VGLEFELIAAEPHCSSGGSFCCHMNLLLIAVNQAALQLPYMRAGGIKKGCGQKYM